MIANEPVAEAWTAYRQRLVQFVRRRVDSYDAAEDIVQDVLMRAYAQRDTLRSGGRLEPWLFQITRNAIVDHYRARRPAGPLPDDLAEPEAPDPGVRAELAACIAPLLEQLAPRYREALRLAELQGLTHQEAAARLGLSLSGAKSRVQRGRAKLRDLLLRCCRVEVDSRGAPMDYSPNRPCGPACGS